jgi:hypothetical protein
MAIVLACPGCGARGEFRDEDAGRAGQCAKCHGEIRVPLHTKMCVSCRKLVAADAASCPACGTALAPGAAVSRLPADMMPPTAAAGPETSPKAIWSLVLGLLGLFLTCLTGIPAMILGVLALADIRRRPDRYEGQGMAVAGIVTGGIGTLLLLPLAMVIALAVWGVRLSQTVYQSAAFQAAPCQNNLKQIGLALHNYHAAYDSFPPAATHDADGNPLLSWRVLLLPYLGENALYQQFRLDEPWDSPHNLPLAARMPFVFRCPYDPMFPTDKTSYVALTGEGTAFPPTSAVTIRQITDGTANTAVVSEIVSSTIVWTKPEDVVVDENFVAAQKLGSNHGTGWSVLMADGAARFVDVKSDDETIHSLISIGGGEPVSPDDLDL